MRILLFNLLSFISFSGFAQAIDSTLVIYDTIVPAPAKVTFYASLKDFYGDTLLVLDKPKGYVIETHDYSDSPIKVALQTKGGYNVFTAMGEDYIHSSFSCERINFNNTGTEELLISWEYHMGRSGYIDGWNEYYTGFCIVDLDEAALIFEMQDHYDHTYWWTGIIMDSTGQYMTDSLGEFMYSDSGSGSESECEIYSVDIQINKIVVKPSDECDDSTEISEDSAQATITTYVYVPENKKRKAKR